MASLVGFDDLGNSDSFPTKTLEARLARTGAFSWISASHATLRADTQRTCAQAYCRLLVKWIFYKPSSPSVKQDQTRAIKRTTMMPPGTRPAGERSYGAFVVDKVGDNEMMMTTTNGRRGIVRDEYKPSYAVEAYCTIRFSHGMPGLGFATGPGIPSAGHRSIVRPLRPPRPSSHQPS